jgi:hypothetical protein
MLNNASHIQLGRVNAIGTIANPPPSVGGATRTFNVTPLMIKPAIELQQARIAISLANGQNEFTNRSSISNNTSSNHSMSSLSLGSSSSNGSSSPNSPTVTSSLSFVNYFNNVDQSYNLSPSVLANLHDFKNLISSLQQQQQQAQPLTPTSPQLPVSGKASLISAHLNAPSNQSQSDATTTQYSRSSEKRVIKLNNYILIETNNNNTSNESFNMAFNTSNKRFFHWKVK